MDFIGPIIDILRNLYSCFSQQVDYLRNFEENVENLVTKHEELSEREKEVAAKIEKVGMETGKKPKSEAMQWQKNVEKVRKQVHEIEQKSRQNLRCCKGFIPNYYSLLKLSKKAAKKIEKVNELQDKSRFVDGLFSDLLDRRMTIPTTALGGRTTEETKEMIWESLMDDNVSIIGVYGYGGVGKTTIMTHIYNQLIKESVFDSVIWVTVSKASSTLEQFQFNIAKSLDFDLPTEADEMKRSQELYAALMRRKKFVLILDDMWTAFPLEKVGIPLSHQENGSKLVLTTRSLEICREMESQKTIRVEVLTEEEAWKLFKDKVGDDFSLEVEAIAMLVAKECNGLPLAIVTIARSMREKDNIRLWRNTLNELRCSKTEIQSMEENVFPSLRVSYRKLRNERIQACFLYCALYPEDYEIPVKDLIEHWMGDELIEEVGDREAEMDKGHAILDELKSACMLEGVLNGIYGECIRMHDLIRDMAINITRVSPRFMVKAGIRLKVEPNEDEWLEDVERISLMQNNFETLSRKHNCPNLSTLFLQENRCLKVIHDGFFEHMQSLRVLDLSNTKIESLPSSVCNLENLRILLLHYCIRLKKLPSVVKLKKLRVLDLYYAPIEELPEGMEALANLRCLNLSWTYKLHSIPANIISHLSNLEDLRMYGNKWRWPSNGIANRGATIEEIKSLSCLANLNICIADLSAFLSYINSQKWQALKSFYLMVGSQLESELLPSDYTIEIHCCDLMSQLGSLVLPDNTRVLGIFECHLTRLTQLFCLSNMSELKECSIYRCNEIECILMENENTLPSLETLDLNSLPKMQALYKGVVLHGTLNHLKNLYIKSCNGLKNLFSLELLLHLQNLEEIKVRDCDLMEEIIVAKTGQHEIRDNDTICAIIELPRLKKLSLHRLCLLRSICERVIICSSLRSVSIRACPNLSKLPFSIDNPQPALEEVKGEKVWWDALEWDNISAKALLQPHFKEIAH